MCFIGEVVLYNIFYEIFTVCTSIVAEDKTGEYSSNIILWSGPNRQTTWYCVLILKPGVTKIGEGWHKIKTQGPNAK